MIFKSGKYQGKSYIDIWNTNPDYFYWLAKNMNGDFWSKVVRELELRDKNIANSQQQKDTIRHSKLAPSEEEIKNFFMENPICGFDMSDFIISIYKGLNNIQRNLYLESLLQRNNLIFTK